MNKIYDVQNDNEKVGELVLLYFYYDATNNEITLVLGKDNVFTSNLFYPSQEITSTTLRPIAIFTIPYKANDWDILITQIDNFYKLASNTFASAFITILEDTFGKIASGDYYKILGTRLTTKKILTMQLSNFTL